jgi:phage shock protein C
VADRLYRSRDERMIGGVAGGMAQNLGLDPTIVRIGWVLLALVAPITPLVYFVLMFVIPEEPETWTPLAESRPDAAASSVASPPTATATTAPTDREARRDARRAARVARRGPGDRSAALILGVLLILVGGWFLVRPYIPRFDIGVYWPYVVIGLGLVLIVAAAGRRGPSAD